MKARLLELLKVSALLALYILAAFWAEYDDEWDNILTGQLTAQGRLIYRDTFSHHFPLPYLISALYHLFDSSNFVGFRIFFNLTLFLWVVCTIAYIKKSRPHDRDTNQLLWIVGFSLAILAPVAWMHMLLAETLISYALLTAYLVILHKTNLDRRDLTLLILLANLIVLSSIGYIYLSAVLVVFVIWHYITTRKSFFSLDLLTVLVVGSIPSLLWGLFALFTGSWREFVWQSLTFNKKYYFPFIGNPPDSPIANLIYVIRSILAGFENLILNYSTLQFGTFYLSMLILGVATIIFSYGRVARSSYVTLILLALFSLSRWSPEFDIANNRNTPWYPLAILGFGILCIKAREFLSRPHILGAALAFTMIFMISSVASRWCDITLKIIDGQFNRNQDDRAQRLALAIPENEKYWIGPFAFRTQYFLKREHVSKYTFFLAWHGRSPKITKDLINSLKYERPKYIYFERDLAIWNHSPRNYGRKVLNHIDQRYRPDPIDPNLMIRVD